MIAFQVDDMTCGHCVSTLTRALAAADPQAKVRFDLAQHRVQIEPAQASAQALREAIAAAGYTPVPLEPMEPVQPVEPVDAARAAATAPRARQGGCCGCGG